MFNTKFTGLVVAGLLLAAGAAQAFAGGVDESGIRLPARITYSDLHRGMPQQAQAVFPSSVDEAGIRLPVGATYGETRGDMPQQTQAVFPTSVDEAGVRLQPRAVRTEEQRGRMMESMRAGVRSAQDWID